MTTCLGAVLAALVIIAITLWAAAWLSGAIAEHDSILQEHPADEEKED